MAVEFTRSESYLDRLFVIAQVAWAITVGIWTVVGGVGREHAYIIWFVGFLIAIEITPTSTLQPDARRILRFISILGYLVFAVAAYSLLLQL